VSFGIEEPDMLTGMELMTCPNLAVPAQVMSHVIDVESSYNPYAIGVVNGQLVRQPQNLDEALATAQMLEQKGYNFSVGVAQINHANLVKYGLDSYEKAFDACGNVAVGSRILAECYASSGGDWGKAFSCYYSGNFVTGFRDGYVQKIYDSIGRSIATAGAQQQSSAIPLRVDSGQVVTRSQSQTITMPVAAPDSAAYRVAIRSVVLDTVTESLVAPAVSAALKTAAPAAQAAPVAAAAQPAMASQATAPAPTAAAPAKPAVDNDVFVPRVRGPGDPPSGSSASAYGATAAVGASSGATNAVSTTAANKTDPADVRQGSKDDAFVF
jgi:type IV secretion system protein VirB1